MEDAKEEVRARLNIEDVVGEYVQLKRAGRNFKGLSPFTNERTPSFTVSPDKHIWHDFSSGQGGDVFSFVMAVEGLDFRAALELLARKAGVELSMFDSKRSGEIAKKKARIAEANELAARYFQQCLVKNQHALEYVFGKRKLSKEIVQEFKIGYAPDGRDAMVRALANKGFSTKELGESGLINRFGGDLFRGRMAVPLMSSDGRVIGFTGRIVEDVDNAPKYLNTPQTLLYDKSRHVFGLSQAKEAIRKADFSVMVEGNLDVIASHQVGVKNVVASAGTAMTEYHLKSLSRLSNNVKLAFDRDRAGLAATERAIPLAAKVGLELTIISLPDTVKDPDELIQQDPEAWKVATLNSQPVVDWVLGQYSEREDMTSAQGKRRFTTAGLEVVRQIPDSVEQEHYLQEIAAQTNTSLEAVRAKLTSVPEKSAQTTKKTKQVDIEPVDDIDAYQDQLLAALLLQPIARSQLGGLDLSLFRNEKRHKFAKWLQSSSAEITDTIPQELREVETYVKIVQLQAETRYTGWSEQDMSLEIARLLRRQQTEHKKQHKNQLTDQLRSAEESGDEAASAALRKELMQLIKEIASGK